MTDNNGTNKNGNETHLQELVEKILGVVDNETYEDGMKALDIAKSFLEYTLMKMALKETFEELFKD